MTAIGASVLAATGVVLSAIISFAYAEFYASLGISPGDVGLGYANSLASATGFVLGVSLLALVIMVFLFPIILSKRRLAISGLAVGCIAAPILGRIFFSGMLRYIIPLLVTGLLGVVVGMIVRKRSTTTSERLFRRIPSAAQLRNILVTVMVLAVTLAGILLPIDANRAADEVMRGSPVPVERFGPLVLLAIRADPVAVEPPGKAIDAQPILALSQKSLLYLGQANNKVVLYDSDSQEAIFVPTASVIVHVSNCDARKQFNARCDQLFDYSLFG